MASVIGVPMTAPALETAVRTSGGGRNGETAEENEMQAYAT